MDSYRIILLRALLGSVVVLPVMLNERGGDLLLLCVPSVPLIIMLLRVFTKKKPNLFFLNVLNINAEARK